MLKLYGFPQTRSDRVAWILQELDLEYEFIKVDLMKGEHRSPEFLAVNPNGKVPALVDGDVVLYESAAICIYLAEKHPEKGLLPTDLVERAELLQWLFFCFTELEAPLWTRQKHTFVFPEKWRVPEIFPSCEWEFQRRLKTVETVLADGREYLVGSKFTVADLILTGIIGWAKSLKLVPAEDYPHTLAYGKRNQKRFKTPA